MEGEGVTHSHVSPPLTLYPLHSTRTPPFRSLAPPSIMKQQLLADAQPFGALGFEQTNLGW